MVVTRMLRKTTATRMFVEDDALIEHVVSFCDFHSAIAIGKTCKRFKRISDDCLDHVVASIVKRSSYDASAGMGARVQTELSLRNLKHDDCTKYMRASVIQDGIELCNPMDNAGVGMDYYPPEDVTFVEDQARYFLDTKGYVEIEDFLTPAAYTDDNNHDDENFFYDDFGWSVTVGLQTNNDLDLRKVGFQRVQTNDLDVRQMAIEIMRPGYKDNTNYDEDDFKGEWEYAEWGLDYRTIQYRSLCLLRKADPSSFRRKFLNVDTRRNEYPMNKYRSWISFRVPSAPNCDGDNDNTAKDDKDKDKDGSTEFEFYYSMETDLRYWS